MSFCGHDFKENYGTATYLSTGEPFCMLEIEPKLHLYIYSDLIFFWGFSLTF